MIFKKIIHSRWSTFEGLLLVSNLVGIWVPSDPKHSKIPLLCIFQISLRYFFSKKSRTCIPVFVSCVMYDVNKQEWCQNDDNIIYMIKINIKYCSLSFFRSKIVENTSFLSMQNLKNDFQKSTLKPSAPFLYPVYCI